MAVGGASHAEGPARQRQGSSNMAITAQPLAALVRAPGDNSLKRGTDWMEGGRKKEARKEPAIVEAAQALPFLQSAAIRSKAPTSVLAEIQQEIEHQSNRQPPKAAAAAVASGAVQARRGPLTEQVRTAVAVAALVATPTTIVATAAAPWEAAAALAAPMAAAAVAAAAPPAQVAAVAAPILAGIDGSSCRGRSCTYSASNGSQWQQLPRP
jgi:hypothetical protein